MILSACPKSSSEPSDPVAQTSAAPAVTLTPEAAPTEQPTATGIDTINHVVVIVMENRSFDHYFGTYPGAAGFPNNYCSPDPAFGGKCQKPFHDTDTVDVAGPHTKPASDVDVNHGKMDGFITSAFNQPDNTCAKDRSASGCSDRLGPQQQPEVMAYHTASEIPVYWRIADWGVLQDHLFAPSDSWTLPAHLFLVSAWSAYCSKNDAPMSCRSSLGTPDRLDVPKKPGDTPYAWTDITFLLNEAGISWSYFIAPGGTCYQAACDKASNQDKTTGYQNVLPGFTTVVKEDKQEKNIRSYTEYLNEAKAGTLPSVSWVMPAIGESDHPGHADIKDGQRFIAKMVNAVSQGPSWNDTAIFITWDDWGGFFDHMKPVKVDENGYGIRVPGLMISAYAKQGEIDHQTLSFDAYLKFIEDRFLDGARLDPKRMSRPDSRPTVREDVRQLGDLANEFDFTQAPRKPLVLKAP